MHGKLFLFLITFPLFAHGTSCSSEASLDLSAAGGPLYPLRITNQNGLGICHIEQLHKMVKARLSGHPDLSRVQMAITEKKVRDQKQSFKKAVRWKNEKGVGGTYIDAGNSCEAFNRLKNQEICSAENDRFEQLTKHSPENQEKIIESLSLYFDARPKLHPFLNYSNPFQNSDIVRRLDSGLKICRVTGKEFSDLKEVYLAHIKAHRGELGSHYPAALKLGQDLKMDSLELSGMEFMQGKTYWDKIAEGLPYSLSFGSPKPLLKKMDTLVAAMGKKETCVSEFLKRPNLVLNCSPLTKEALGVLDLQKLGMDLREIVRILDGNLDRDRFFGEAFACNGNKIKIPGSINCKTIELNPFAKKASDRNEYHRKVSGLIDQQIAKKTPVGISTCTRFFQNPKAQTMELKTGSFNCGNAKKPGYTKGEGSHAVTIIGKRCHQGQVEYLVQNSWGSGCFYSKTYECTKKGGFWAPSDIVIDNIRNINFLE